MRLADSPVMGGSVVSVGDPGGCVRPEPAGVAEIRVASGPAAGALHRLAFGEADIGGPIVRGTHAAEVADIVIADPAIAPVALRVLVDRHGCQVASYDGVRATLDREPLQAAAYWRLGQQVAVGGTLLDLARYEPPDAALHPSEDGGGFEFNCPPRLLPPECATKFAFRSRPANPNGDRCRS